MLLGDHTTLLSRADHRTCCKFAHQGDGNYGRIRDKIRDLIKSLRDSVPAHEHPPADGNPPAHGHSPTHEPLPAARAPDDSPADTQAGAEEEAETDFASNVQELPLRPDNFRGTPPRAPARRRTDPVDQNQPAQSRQLDRSSTTAMFVIDVPPMLSPDLVAQGTAQTMQGAKTKNSLAAFFNLSTQNFKSSLSGDQVNSANSSPTIVVTNSNQRISLSGALASTQSCSQNMSNPYSHTLIQRALKTDAEISTSDSWKQKLALTMDGGFERGIAALLLLHELMTRVDRWEHFWDDHFGTKPPEDDELPWKARLISPFSATNRPSSRTSTWNTAWHKVNAGLHPRRQVSPKKISWGQTRYLPCHYFDYIGGTGTGG